MSNFECRALRNGKCKKCQFNSFDLLNTVLRPIFVKKYGEETSADIHALAFAADVEKTGRGSITHNGAVMVIYKI